MFKKRKPITPSLRHSVTLLKDVNKKFLLKSNIKNHKRSLGKSGGKIVSRHRERGAKKRYRQLKIISEDSLEGVVCSIEHDPYRSGFIMSVFDTFNKKFFYSIAQDKVHVGESISARKENILIKNGNISYIKNIPPGSLISNVSLKKGKGKISRAAGTYCLIKSHTTYFSFLELPSGEIRLVPSSSKASVGRVSNDQHLMEQSGKAGRTRWKGWRPKTRGVAMNPVDHPNGGGEGKKSGKGRTPWGKPGKGIRTSCRKRNNKLILKKYYEQI